MRCEEHLQGARCGRLRSSASVPAGTQLPHPFARDPEFARDSAERVVILCARVRAEELRESLLRGYGWLMIHERDDSTWRLVRHALKQRLSVHGDSSVTAHAFLVTAL